MTAFPIVHIEIVTNDPRSSADFFGRLFGWKITTTPDFEGYHMFQPESGPGGAFMSADNQLFKPGDVVLYAQTDDIDATLRQVQEMGGTVLVPKTDIPAVGWFAVFSDPSGTRMSLYTPLPR
jgi:uncharacterized protein